MSVLRFSRDKFHDKFLPFSRTKQNFGSRPSFPSKMLLMRYCSHRLPIPCQKRLTSFTPRLFVAAARRNLGGSLPRNGKMEDSLSKNSTFSGMHFCFLYYVPPPPKSMPIQPQMKINVIHFANCFSEVKHSIQVSSI